MKISTTLTHRYGATITVGTAGDVTFDKHGFAEVSDELAALIVSETDTICLSLNKPEEPAEQDKPEEPAEDAFLSLSKLTVKELKQIAEDAGLPEANWSSLKKDDLVKYIVDNIQD